MTIHRDSEFLKKRAQKEIQKAEEELMKPKEDVVSFSVCANSRLAMQQLLESYLLKNNILIKKHEPLALLLERCIKLNPKFKTIDFSNVDCRYNANNKNYCSGLDKVNNCLNIAKQIEDLLNK